MKMSNDDKAREVYRKSLTKARDEMRALLAGDPLPREMHDDVLDLLEHVEAILEADETTDERDAGVDNAIGEIGE
jgi:hypothetical protein